VAFDSAVADPNKNLYAANARFWGVVGKPYLTGLGKGSPSSDRNSMDEATRAAYAGTKCFSCGGPTPVI
jgi:hypothetical protein